MLPPAGLLQKKETNKSTNLLFAFQANFFGDLSGSVGIEPSCEMDKIFRLLFIAQDHDRASILAADFVVSDHAVLQDRILRI